MPENPNVLLVEPGFRGVKATTLDAGTTYVNPYVERIDLVDCRSKRFDLNTGGEMGFPSKDGFWVTLDGTIEFRVMPEKAAHVFVTYNDDSDDEGGRASVEQEIINKVILPNARSFCRLRGSDHSGKEFISGDTRIKFQEDFQNELARTCESQGIKIIQALITRINPPQKIAKPVRERQIAAQQQEQYRKQIIQQESEKDLAIQTELIKQKQAIVEADRGVIRVVTQAKREQEVALILAQQKLKVAELELQAAADLAAAIKARGLAAAEVVKFKNVAEAAGWKRAVAAFSNDGDAFARWVMLKKIAPAYRQMMVNTADSPIMDIFRQFEPDGVGTSPKELTPEIELPTELPELASDSN
jgi:regulator of protease activity HflC (stomatin/prohibitin superfamily)